MKKIKTLLVSLLAMFVLVGCANGSNEPKESKEVLNVVSSFSILSDITEEIGKDKVNVYNLVPIGTDPHEYEPLPEDNKAATNADLLLYNGLNLEGGESGWFFKLVDSLKLDKDKVYEAGNGIVPMYLGKGSADEQINPHVFLDPQNGIIMAENVRDALVATDPDNKDFYIENATAYINELKGIDTLYQETVNSIPEEHRVFVASEHAFQYMTERYGLEHLYIWEIDTEELGTTEQIRTLIDQLNAKKPPVLFLESNVETRPMEQVSSETGIPIFEESIYSDELGKKGTPGETYIKFLHHNIRIIEEGLK